MERYEVPENSHIMLEIDSNLKGRFDVSVENLLFKENIINISKKQSLNILENKEDEEILKEREEYVNYVAQNISSILPKELNDKSHFLKSLKKKVKKRRLKKNKNDQNQTGDNKGIVFFFWFADDI